jgi:hypothetical protein
MRLRQLQLDMQHHVLGDDNAMAPAGAFATAIVDAPPLPAADRLAIYRNAYRVRLTEALDESYPVLHKVLGDELFMALGEAFIAGHPSVYRSIRWYGRELADFVAHTAPYAGQPILAEIALFEWTLTEVFDAVDAQSLERAALYAIDPTAWAELKIRFHPSVRRLSLAWNTAAVWRAISHDEAPPQPELAGDSLPWLLWRQDLQNYFRSVDAIEAAALDAAMAGSTFGEICAALTQWLPEDEIPLRAATLLSAWADGGIIVGLHLCQRS